MVDSLSSFNVFLRTIQRDLKIVYTATYTTSLFLLRTCSNTCSVHLTCNMHLQLRHYLMSHAWAKWRRALIQEKTSIQSVYYSNQLLLKQVKEGLVIIIPCFVDIKFQFEKSYNAPVSLIEVFNCHNINLYIVTLY